MSSATIAALSIDAQAQMHRALGDSTRQHIMTILAEKGGTISVVELTEELADRYHRFEQPTVSHHLAILREAGFIEGERHGLYKYYRVRTETLHALADALGGGR